MGIGEKVGLKILNKREVQIIVITVLIIIIACSPILSIELTQPSSNETVETDPIEGTSGCVIEKNGSTPVRNLILFNDTIMSESIEWHNPWFSNDCEAYESQDGVTLNMEVSPAGTRVRYDGYLSLPVVNYTQMMIDTNVRVLKGNVTIRFYVRFIEWPSISSREGGMTEIELSAGESSEISISPLIENLYVLDSEWIARLKMSIDIVVHEPSTVTVGDVVVSVESQEDLYPVTFDIQAPDGKSIFENKYINQIGGMNRHDSREVYYPAFRLTTSNNYTYHSSAYGPYRTNETLFLPVGNYTGYAGWNRGTLMSSTSGTVCNFTLSPGESISVTARISVRRLYVKMNPLFPYTSVSVLDYHEVRFDSNEDYFILYRTSYLDIRIRPLHEHKFRVDDIYQFDNRIGTKQILLQDLEPNSTLTITVTYSRIAIGGLILDYGQLIWLISSIMLGVTIIISLLPLHTRPGFKRRVLPLVPLFLGAILPWVHYEFTEGTITVGGTLFIPFSTTVWSGENGMSSFVPTSYLTLNLIITGLLFWLPLAALLYSPLIKGNLVDLYSSEDMELKALVLLGPIVLSAYYVSFCIYNNLIVGLGCLIVVCTFLPALIASFFLHRKNSAPHLKHVE